MSYKMIAVDTSKSVFTLHGVDAAGRAALRRDYGRKPFEAFFARPEPTEAVLEAFLQGAVHTGGLRPRRGQGAEPPAFLSDTRNLA